MTAPYNPKWSKCEGISCSSFHVKEFGIIVDKKVFSLYNPIKSLGKSLAHLVVGVGTRHSHQILFTENKNIFVVTGSTISCRNDNYRCHNVSNKMGVTMKFQKYLIIFAQEILLCNWYYDLSVFRPFGVLTLRCSVSWWSVFWPETWLEGPKQVLNNRWASFLWGFTPPPPHPNLPPTPPTPTPTPTPKCRIYASMNRVRTG